VLNESFLLQEQLEALAGWRQAGHEVIVVDGGSREPVSASQRELLDHFVETRPGRAMQMNHGVGLASGEVLLFLHVDTRLPQQAGQLICAALQDSSKVWGRFDVRLSGGSLIFRVIERAISIRSHITGIVSGDQGLFVRRSVFEQLNGYASIPLMEDIEISKRLRRISWPVRIREPVVTSSRRWEDNGVFRTILLMWWLRLRYFFGTSPEKLVSIYYR
jgi:rSAM/selenodomain-associated transferase 2